MTILHIMGVILMILALVARLYRDEVDRDRGGSRTSELFLTLLRMRRNERNVIGITEGEVEKGHNDIHRAKGERIWISLNGIRLFHGREYLSEEGARDGHHGIKPMLYKEEVILKITVKNYERRGHGLRLESDVDS